MYLIGGLRRDKENKMKKIYCDLCKKEIERTEIPVTLKLNAGGKNIEADMHSICYYRFIRELGKEIQDGEEEKD